MKKFYCLYNKKNTPFSWKLKQVGEITLAHFKSREDCLNYYLSLDNSGIIWFQKLTSKVVEKENLKNSFDGYIKTSFFDGIEKHTIAVTSSSDPDTINKLRENLGYLLQIDLETGKDLLKAKGVDRLYDNKNSYLILNDNVAEEIMSLYNINADDKDITSKFNELNLEDSQFNSAKLLRERIQNSNPTIQPKNIIKKDIVLKPKEEEIAKEEERTNAKETDVFVNNDNNSKYIAINSSQRGNNIEEYWNNFAVNINDFNFKNDFETQPLNLELIHQDNFKNFNFTNNLNNGGIILKNSFYQYYRNKGDNMKFGNNPNNEGNQNDIWVPVPVGINQNPSRPYNGTIEFTAVPNQMLSADMNPLGANTMIFNPYHLQNKDLNPYSNSHETIIQPIIQPIIQHVPVQSVPVQPVSTTKVLEPIINEPIMANPYNDYYSYINTMSLQQPTNPNTMSLQQPTNPQNTSEFNFNNEKNNDKQPVPKKVKQVKQVRQPKKAPKVRQPKKKKRVLLPVIMTISLLVAVGIITVVVLIFTNIIVI